MLEASNLKVDSAFLKQNAVQILRCVVQIVVLLSNSLYENSCRQSLARTV